MKMHNPPHPGEVIRALCLEPLELTVTDAAAALGVSRKTLSAILNGRAGISPEMAVRLSIAFGTSAESWLNQQTQYDLWHAEKRRKDLKVARPLPEIPNYWINLTKWPVPVRACARPTRGHFAGYPREKGSDPFYRPLLPPFTLCIS